MAWTVEKAGRGSLEAMWRAHEDPRPLVPCAVSTASPGRVQDRPAADPHDRHMNKLEINNIRTLLTVWAHPDDEAYLSAGLMLRVAEAGGRVVCLTATRG